MNDSILRHHDDEFEERNTFLYFVLGLVSLSERLPRLLRAEPPTPAAPEAGTGGEPPPPDALRDLLI